MLRAFVMTLILCPAIAFGASTKVSGNLIATPTQEHLAGYMDDVRIYNRALTLAEIQTLAGCTPVGGPIDLVKRAFWLDGTPIPTGANIPRGVEFKYRQSIFCWYKL